MLHARRMAPERPAGEPVLLSPALRHDVVAACGRTYRLFVSIPAEPAPADGFPLIALVDGNALFPPALAAARLQAARPEVTGVGPAVLLGIGYPGEAAFDHLRRQQDLLPGPDGADRFLSFVMDEALPLVAGMAPLDPRRRSLVGHSFGGVFTLHALFTRPGLFRSHVAGSPSIWWNDGAIRAAEAAFRPPASGARPRLLITVGGDEQPAEGTHDPQRTERLRRARMLDNAREMAERLALTGRIACRHVVFPDENHVSVIPAMLARAVAFAAAADSDGAQA